MIIVDLDNCIADDRWRVPLIRWDIDHLFIRYHSYHMAIPGDRVANLDVIRGNPLIIMTSRPRRYEWLTVEWLNRHQIFYTHLFMREDKADGRPSPIVKQEQVEKLRKIISLDRIIMAYDDRQDVVDMYTKAGLPAQRLAIHSFAIEENNNGCR